MKSRSSKTSAPKPTVAQLRHVVEAQSAQIAALTAKIEEVSSRANGSALLREREEQIEQLLSDLRSVAALTTFPELFDYAIVEENGRKVLQNKTSDGRSQVFDGLKFHGGLGSTLEMRAFAEAGLLDELKKAGFGTIKVYSDDYAPYGIVWRHKQSFPISVRI